VREGLADHGEVALYPPHDLQGVLSRDRPAIRADHEVRRTHFVPLIVDTFPRASFGVCPSPVLPVVLRLPSVPVIFLALGVP